MCSKNKWKGPKYDLHLISLLISRMKTPLLIKRLGPCEYQVFVTRVLTHTIIAWPLPNFLSSLSYTKHVV